MGLRTRRTVQTRGWCLLRKLPNLIMTRHMSEARDEFPPKVRRALQERAGNRCSNPGCRCSTSGPNLDPERVTSIGVAAHITAAARGGPRYEPALTPEQRGSISNGIWLCQNCSRLVDADAGRYPVALLREWKMRAEDFALEELATPQPYEQMRHPTGMIGRYWQCPLCGTTVEHGLRVCLGCQAEVVYGATQRERHEWALNGLVLGGLPSIAACGLLPDWLNSRLGWHIRPFFGFHPLTLLIGAALCTAGAVLLVKLIDARHRSRPPRFFRPSVTG